MSAETIVPEDPHVVLRAALAWRRAGFSVVRIRPDGSKRPEGEWKAYQTEAANEHVLTAWFGAGRYGLGVVMGAVSGNAEMLELEGRAAHRFRELEELALASGLIDVWHRVTRSYCERSPGGGYHWIYRVADLPVPGNVKLARRPATAEELETNPDERVKVLAETRGEGGQVVVAPTPGRFHETGASWSLLAGEAGVVPTITAEERCALHDLVSTIDEMPESAPAAQRTGSGGRGSGRPGDDFEARTAWPAILTPHGWTVADERGGTTYWTRPGKSEGTSATTGHAADRDRLYVFTSSTLFEQEVPYTKFGAYALLNHGGDYAAAGRALAAAGYGEQRDRDVPDLSGGVLELPTEAREAAGAFWDERPELAHVRDFARSRRCSPWALLGVVLTRAVVTVPSYVVLPPTVGSFASLNLFCALVGPSGAGKGAAESAAVDAVDFGVEMKPVSPGSGEGLVKVYGHVVKRPKEDGGGWATKRVADAALLSAPEVDTLVALGSRQGSTLLPLLRQAWSGEALGFAYSDPEKALHIERHRYRMGLVLGVQPGRAAPLLDDADGGTPQRFLWLPVNDPEAPDDRPDAPPPLKRWGKWHGARAAGLTTTRQVMQIPQVAVDEIDAARLARLRGEEAALDGHALLARLKVAAALAILAGRDYVYDDDWRLAGVVMAISDATRAGVTRFLQGEAARRDEAFGRREGLRAVVAESVADEERTRRVCGVLRRGLARSGDEWLTGAGVRRLAASRDRGFVDEALALLVASGDVEVDQDGDRQRFRKAQP